MACRSAAIDPSVLAEEIVRLLAQRAPGASICPSDVARSVGDASWRALMDDVRAAAGALADDGTIVVTQGQRVVDITAARGPVRLRRGLAWSVL